MYVYPFGLLYTSFLSIHRPLFIINKIIGLHFSFSYTQTAPFFLYFITFLLLLFFHSLIFCLSGFCIQSLLYNILLITNGFIFFISLQAVAPCFRYLVLVSSYPIFITLIFLHSLKFCHIVTKGDYWFPFA